MLEQFSEQGARSFRKFIEILFMRSPRSQGQIPFSRAAFILTAFCLSLYAASIFAQATPQNPREGATRTIRNLPRKPSLRGPSGSISPDAKVSSPAPAPRGSNPSTSTPTSPGSTPSSAATAAPPDSDSTKASKSTVARLVSFLVKNAIWIVVLLVIPVALILIYFSIRGSPPKEEKEEERRESRIVARIPTADEEEEEGPRRVLPGSDAALAQAADVEREYALVVKEEDLKMPPLPEEGDSSRRKVDCASIKNLMERRNFDEAYQQYVECIDADRKSELNPNLERKLGEHFIRSGQLDKAARILEHHVATHTRDEIHPETYFSLAYIHFRGKTINKSRRYFRLFVERHKDPAQVDRARKILARLDRVQNQN